MTQVPGIGTRRLIQVESASSPTSFMVGKRSEEKLGDTRGKGFLKIETTPKLRKNRSALIFYQLQLTLALLRSVRFSISER